MYMQTLIVCLKDSYVKCYNFMCIYKTYLTNINYKNKAGSLLFIIAQMFACFGGFLPMTRE